MLETKSIWAVCCQHSRRWSLSDEKWEVCDSFPSKWHMAHHQLYDWFIYLL